jgi:hypothetical protein
MTTHLFKEKFCFILTQHVGQLLSDLKLAARKAGYKVFHSDKDRSIARRKASMITAHAILECVVSCIAAIYSIQRTIRPDPRLAALSPVKTGRSE